VLKEDRGAGHFQQIAGSSSCQLTLGLVSPTYWCGRFEINRIWKQFSMVSLISGCHHEFKEKSLRSPSYLQCDRKERQTQFNISNFEVHLHNTETPSPYRVVNTDSRSWKPIS